MGEQTGTHGPRMDEALQHEVRGTVTGGRSSRAEEWRDPEPAGEDQPTGDVRILPEALRGTPEGMTQEDVDQRSDLARHLGISAFPGDREDLLATAEENNAPQQVVSQLQHLPEGRVFANLQEVAVALGIGVEQQRF